MPKYVIEREIPDAGKLTEEQLKAISQHSCGILREMGPQIQWMHSYITDNKVYCVYVADSEEAIKDHAKRGNYPANKISEVRGMIDPATVGKAS
ncbi:MAG TPA: DUF4242 domain-containing protein [Acidisarcina sp.]